MDLNLQVHLLDVRNQSYLLLPKAQHQIEQRVLENRTDHQRLVQREIRRRLGRTIEHGPDLRRRARLLEDRMVRQVAFEPLVALQLLLRNNLHVVLIQVRLNRLVVPLSQAFVLAQPPLQLHQPPHRRISRFADHLLETHALRKSHHVSTRDVA
uniref:(northern house mosquito) hypothetical protein n=1 Tax=Culex pipiens TaxID=7175 RepID=A0A8D8JT96_CULPI